MAIEEEIHRSFLERGLTLSVAESCTGGRLASRLTRLSGSSQYFLGSLVVYSNALKTNLLNVPKETIDRHGAVSREVVLAMAQGVLLVTGSDVALAVSGIAGPTGGSPEKPVGTIWGCIGKRQGDLHAWSFHLEGDRETIMETAVDVLLKELLRVVKP